MDLTITPPPGYCKVTTARWTWADPDCGDCKGTGEIWTSVWDRDISPYMPLYNEDSECECVWSPDDDVLEELSRQYHSWGNLDRARAAWADIAQALGPQHPGGWYRCWAGPYIVDSIDYTFRDGDPASPSWTITVQWADGSRTTHRTRWDHGSHSCGRPPAHHPGPAPTPPELRSASWTPPSRRSFSSRVATWFRALH